MRSLVVGVLGWSILVGPAMAEDGAKKDLAKLVGTWKLVSMDDGKGAKETEGFQIVISEKRLEFRAPNGKKKTMGEIGRIDGSEKPAQIDLKNGNESGLGIYELDGDNLKLIIRDPGEKRATEFQGTAKGLLFVLKREKK